MSPSQKTSVEASLVSTAPSQRVNSARRHPALYAAGWLALAALVIAPWLVPSQFLVHLAVLAALNVISVNGLALISRSGQLSLGHAAFIAVGAYVSVLLSMHAGVGFLLGTVGGMLATGLVALVLGWVILRLRGVYFVLVTFAFGELVRLVLLDLGTLTGGANGLTGIVSAELFGFVFDTRTRFYGLALTLAVVSTFCMYRLFRNPLGHAIDSVANNAALAESTGMNVHRLQVFCFVAGCLLAALAGSLQARYIGYISPESFNTGISVGLIVMLVIGGRHVVLGPVIGAIVLTPLPELFRGAVQTQHIFYGAALILILRFMPGGLASIPTLMKRLWRRAP